MYQSTNLKCMTSLNYFKMKELLICYYLVPPYLRTRAVTVEIDNLSILMRVTDYLCMCICVRGVLGVSPDSQCCGKEDSLLPQEVSLV